MGNLLGNTGGEDKDKIFQAVKDGDIDMLKKLISKGVNVAKIVNTTQWTLLHVASQYGYSSIVEILIKYGAEVNAVNNVQWTPLHFASRYGHSLIVESLIKHGAEVNAVDIKRWTPLYVASRHGHSLIVKNLINHGAEIDALNNNQHTPLNVASRYGHSSIVEGLIKHGAEVDAVNCVQYTPLHLASYWGHSSIVESLINFGAEINAVNNTLETPLHTASRNGHISTVDILIKHEAKVNVVNEFHRTPLDVAVENDHCDVVYYFINKLKVDITQLDQAKQQKINKLLKEAEEKQDKRTKSQQESIKVMLEKLEQAKANNETLKVSYTTILFSGSSGVGKTSLLKKLNKENLSRYHHSTGVAQSKHTVCIKTTAVIKSAKGLHWVDLDYDSLINHLNKHLHNLRFPSLTLMSAASLSPAKKASTDFDENLPNPKILSQSSTAASSSKDNTQNAIESKSVIKQNRETVAKVHSAAVDIARADSSDTPELGNVWDIINFLDTGGQPEFVNILPAVSSSIALTFIVLNLRKSLNDFVCVEHNVFEDPSFRPYDLDCTNLEFIKHLMVSSENFNKSLPLSLKLKGTQRKDGGNDS